jgi:predicted regulator of Ras-like GTPase activity (Roadblock/LC7/MglB family)
MQVKIACRRRVKPAGIYHAGASGCGPAAYRELLAFSCPPCYTYKAVRDILRDRKKVRVMSRLLEVPAVPQGRQGSGTSRLDELNRILRKLQIDSPGIETSALISEDGLMIARADNMNMEETRVAGMAATLLNLGTRASMELSRGAVQEVIVRGEHGYAVVLSAGRGTLLLSVTNEASKLGLIFFDMREAIRALQKVL